MWDKETRTVSTTGNNDLLTNFLWYSVEEILLLLYHSSWKKFMMIDQILDCFIYW